METALAGSLPLQQRDIAPTVDVTPAVTRVRRSANNRSNSTHLAAIATWPALSELRGLRFYKNVTMPGIAHETHGENYTVECAYAATNVQNLFDAGERGKKSQDLERSHDSTAQGALEGGLRQGRGKPETRHMTSTSSCR